MTLWGAIAALQLELARLAEEVGKLKGQVGSEAQGKEKPAPTSCKDGHSINCQCIGCWWCIKP
jgi:hypothetical protein